MGDPPSPPEAADGRRREQVEAAIPLRDVPTTSKLASGTLRGTGWQNPDAHRHDIERLWRVLDRVAR